METIQDPKKHSKFVFVFTGHLDGTLLDDEEKTKPDHKTLLDQLEPEIGDELLIALRKIFSLTYTDKFEVKDLDKVVSRIKFLAIDALKPFARVLDALKQKPLSARMTEEEKDRVRIYKYNVVRRSDLRFQTKDAETDELAPLVDLIPTADADGVLIALRKIVSVAFSEMLDRRDYRRRLHEIRMLTAQALVPLNEWLEEIELEPVAMPNRPFPEYVEEENMEAADDQHEVRPPEKEVSDARRRRRNRIGEK